MADRTGFPLHYDPAALATTNPAAIDAALTAASAAAYSAANLASMTLNDKIYAHKQLIKNTTLPPADGNTAWVNPWDANGA
jgi:hypothetical protein